ncbi:MAG: hypothetical protein KC776_06335 [Myxococcales bacterium]|nr:hypothetical protein [Myxococcales bacterium]MCB9578739.1 hypothetical protein [Polyangiaceae bacterium]
MAVASAADPEHRSRMAPFGPRQRATTVTLAAVLLALLACKKSSDPSPSASAELPSGGSPTPVEPEVPAPTATATDTTAAPTTPTPTTVTPTPTTTATAKPTTTATTSSTAAPSATATTTAPAGPSKACVEKCQSVLQVCLTPKATDGGFPQMADPTKCQQAFTDCQSACK